MTIATTTEGKNYYVDGWLLKWCGKQKTKINTKDRDCVIIVDGEEGSGKSVLAMQMAKTVDPTLNLDRVCFTPQDFEAKVKSAKKGQAVIFDEAFRGYSSRSATSTLNKELVAMMMEVRQQNLFIVIVLPRFFILDSYVAVDRGIGLVHTYKKGDSLGYWVYFNKSIKHSIFKFGKKTREYKNKYIPNSKRRGRFYDQYVIDEQRYRAKKKEAFINGNTKDVGKASFYKEQRDILLSILKDRGVAVADIITYMAGYGCIIGRGTVNDAIKLVKDKMLARK